MSNLQYAVEKVFEPFHNKPNTPEVRALLEHRMNKFFTMLDQKGYSRPIDFNIAIGDKGELQVFFAKDFSPGKDF